MNYLNQPVTRVDIILWIIGFLIGKFIVDFLIPKVKAKWDIRHVKIKFKEAKR